MIKNALSLQNKIDGKYIDNIDKFNSDFAVEALANAGQRLGMKGDSIHYTAFSIADLLTIMNKDYLININNDYNCAVKYIKTGVDSDPYAIMSVIPSNETLNNDNQNTVVLLDKNENENINLFGEHYIAQEFQFEKPINNIDYFLENSFITVNENIFKTFLFGKKLGCHDDDDFNVEILYNEFNLKTNILERAVRMYHLFSLSNSNYYAILDIQKNQNIVDNKDNQTFILKVFIMNDRMVNETEDQINKNEIKRMFCLRFIKEDLNNVIENLGNGAFKEVYNRYIDTIDNDSYFNYVNENSSLYQIISNYSVLNFDQEATSIDDVLKYDTISHVILKQTNLIDSTIIGDNLTELSNSIARYLRLNGFEEDVQTAVQNIYRDTSLYATIIKNNQASDLSENLKYNSTKNAITSTTSDYIKNEIRNLLDSDFVGIDKRIEYINNDIVYLFPKLLQKYNEDVFSTREQIIKNIILRLYEKVYENSSSLNDNFGTLYIPLNYKFNYVSNNNNDLEMYYSNELFVSMFNFDNLSKLDKQNALENKTTLIYDYEGEDKVKVFSFNIEYNNMYSNIINNVYLNYLYTLPYINAQNSWTINDNDTHILAKHNEEFFQNFLILYCENKNDVMKHKLVNAVNEADFNIREWEIKTINLNSDTIFKCSIPKIDENNINKFLGTALLVVCDPSCIVNNANDARYNCSVFMHVVSKDGEYYFDPIYIDDQKTNMLDLSTVINKDDIINNVANNLSLSSRIFEIIYLLTRDNSINHENKDVNKGFMITVNTGSEIVELLKSSFGASNVTQGYDNNYVVGMGIVNKNDNSDEKYLIQQSNNQKYLDLKNKIDTTNGIYYLKNNAKVEETEISQTFYRARQYYVRETTYSNTKQTFIDIYDTIERVVVKQNSEKYEEIKKIIQFEAVKIDTGEIEETVVWDEADGWTPTQEYLFNDNIPLLNLKEMFIANANTLNRVNILSLDADGNIFNGFIGSDYTSNKKNQLLISTSNRNINVGTDTLIKPEEMDLFKKYKSVKIQFDEIVLSSKSVRMDVEPIVKKTIDETSVYVYDPNILNVAQNIDVGLDKENGQLELTLNYRTDYRKGVLDEINLFRYLEGQESIELILPEIDEIYYSNNIQRGEYVVVNWFGVLNNLVKDIEYNSDNVFELVINGVLQPRITTRENTPEEYVLGEESILVSEITGNTIHKNAAGLNVEINNFSVMLTVLNKEAFRDLYRPNNALQLISDIKFAVIKESNYKYYVDIQIPENIINKINILK